MKIRPTEFPAQTLPPKPREVSRPRQGEVDVRVAVSKAARALADSKKDEPVDLERVERLREQIEAGAYEIDDLALAQALIEKELQWKP